MVDRHIKHLLYPYSEMCDTTLHNMKGKLFGSCEFVTSLHFNLCLYLRNNSWKPYCVVSFNMGWRIILFYPEQWQGIKFTQMSGGHEIFAL